MTGGMAADATLLADPQPVGTGKEEGLGRCSGKPLHWAEKELIVILKSDYQ